MRGAACDNDGTVCGTGRRSGPGSLPRSGPAHPTAHLGFQPAATKRARAARAAATIESSISFLSYLVLEPYGFHLAAVVKDDGARVAPVEGRCVVFRCLRIRSPPVCVAGPAVEGCSRRPASVYPTTGPSWSRPPLERMPRSDVQHTVRNDQIGTERGPPAPPGGLCTPARTRRPVPVRAASRLRRLRRLGETLERSMSLPSSGASPRPAVGRIGRRSVPSLVRTEEIGRPFDGSR